MKKIRTICMALMLSIGLIGCSGKRAATWQSFTYHVTSSVLTEGCHFSITREENGNMLISGYCYAGETEYRVEEAKPVSQETAAAIEAMELENADTAKGKPFPVADGKQITITLSAPNGKERKIALSAQQKEQLRQLLEKELAEQ